MLDHDTDVYKISRAFVDGRPPRELTRDNILDNITLYWLTGTGASAARSYWENGRALVAQSAGQPPPHRSRSRSGRRLPRFRGDCKSLAPGRVAGFQPSPTTTSPLRGHFAAWEEPELFTPTRRAGCVPAAAVTAARPPNGVELRNREEGAMTEATRSGSGFRRRGRGGRQYPAFPGQRLR